MAVKPEAGQVIHETKTTRIENADEKAPGGGRKHPPMWDFIETLTAEQWNSKEYEIILYRGKKFDRGAYCAKYYELIDPERIKKDFGGGFFNLMMKVPPGKQLRYNEDLEIAGAPREDAQISTTPVAGDALSQMVAMFREEIRSLREELRTSRGGDLGLEAVKQALALNGQVFNSAANAATNTLTHLANGGAAPVTPNPLSDPVALMNFVVQIKNMFAPTPTNSLKDTLETLQMFKSAGLMGNAGGSEKLTDKLVMAVVQQLPTLAQYASGMMDSMARSEQAKAQALALQRGQTITVQPVQQPPAPPPQNVLQMPTPAVAPPGEPTPEQKMQMEAVFQLIENRIVALINNQQLTPEQAAEATLKFIDEVDPVEAHADKQNLIDALLKYGQMGVDHLFTSRPILTAVPKGERLEAFKRAFLDMGVRVSAPENMQPNPSTPVA